MRSDPSSTQRLKGTRIARAVVVVVGALAVFATPAFGAVSISDYKITSDMPAFPSVPSNGPSTLQSGANSDAGSFTTFSYPNAAEDLQTAVTNFGPGLLGNAEAVPKCPQAALEAGGAGCPAGSAIGTSRLDVVFAGTTTPFAVPSFPGTLYNAELLGSEPGRLAAVTPTPFGPLVSSIPFFLTPRGNGDYGLTGVLTGITRLTSPPFPADLQVSALGFVINGSANKYVRNPTSCELNVSTGQASGYDDPTTVDGPPYGFVTSGCEQLPYAPKLSLEIGDRGTTKFNGFPPVVVRITQQPGEADSMGDKITFPVELNTNNTAYTLCSQGQADADACPEASRFGWVTAKSPFLGEPLQGPVYLTQQTVKDLPGLLLDLRGRAHIKIQTRTTLVNNKQIQSLVLNAPQLPRSEITIALDGGRKTGVFQNRQDLCFRGTSKTKFNPVVGVGKFYGWNGKQTGDTKVNSTVHGCGPAVTPRLKGATGSRPSLTVTATKHPDAPNMTELRVSLSRNLSLVRSELSRGGSGSAAAAGVSLGYVDRRTLRVTGLPSAGSGRVTIRLRRGAIRVSRRSRGLLKKGRSRRFSVKVSPTPVSGKGTSTKNNFTVKSGR